MKNEKEKGKESKCSFEKVDFYYFFQLVNNSVLWKKDEEFAKRGNISLCNSEKRPKNLVASSTFKPFKTYVEDITAVERMKTNIFMNWPIYIKFAVSEICRVL